MKVALGMLGAAGAVLLTGAMLTLAGWTRPPVHAVQSGYRGTGMAQVTTVREETPLRAANVSPPAQDKADHGGEKATVQYKNIKVLNDLSYDEFNRVMLSITDWVSPEQGCAYCHNVENLADDSLYTKVVARKMLEMTRHINTDWKAHVAQTGVTCYTCHRGEPVPKNIWFKNDGGPHAGGMASDNGGMALAQKSVGLTGLPYDPFTPLLEGKEAIRVISTEALPAQKFAASIQTTERTYGLMIHMSEGLGVNCTFCHNTRAFSQWPQSPPQRAVAWHGIQMARDLNTAWLDPLLSVFPPARRGPTGDAPKLNCATCHQGVSKPLLGVSLAKDYPELQGARP